MHCPLSFFTFHGRKPGVMYLARYSFSDFCYVCFSIDPKDIHEGKLGIQRVWEHPEGFHGLLKHADKSHRSGLIKQKFIFAFNLFSCSTLPHTTEPCEYLSQERVCLRQGLCSQERDWPTAAHLREGGQWRLTCISCALVSITPCTLLAWHKNTGKPARSRHWHNGFREDMLLHS